MAGQGQALGTRHGPLKCITYNHLRLAMLTYKIKKFLIDNGCPVEASGKCQWLVFQMMSVTGEPHTLSGHASYDDIWCGLAEDGTYCHLSWSGPCLAERSLLFLLLRTCSECWLSSSDCQVIWNHLSLSPLFCYHIDTEHWYLSQWFKVSNEEWIP